MSGIVVGVDGSRTALKAAKQAAAMAEALGEPLHLVTSVKRDMSQSMMSGFDVFVDDPMLVAAQRLESIKIAIGAPNATTAQICEDPAQAICAEAESIGAQLIVVGNRRVQGAARVLGSIARDVLRHAHCDVLVVDTTRRRRPLPLPAT